MSLQPASTLGLVLLEHIFRNILGFFYLLLESLYHLPLLFVQIKKELEGHLYLHSLVSVLNERLLELGMVRKHPPQVKL